MLTDAAFYFGNAARCLGQAADWVLAYFRWRRSMWIYNWRRCDDCGRFNWWGSHDRCLPF